MGPRGGRAAPRGGGVGHPSPLSFPAPPCAEPGTRPGGENVAAEMGTRKENGQPEGADFLLRLLGLTPRTIQHVLSRLATSPRTFDLTVSNIPGPRPPLWMLGCELREAYPVVPMADSHSVSIGMTSVRDDVFLGVYADREALPDADRLAALIDGAFDELRELAGELVLA